MKITRITKENRRYYKRFVTNVDFEAIGENEPILPLGLVADDLPDDGNAAAGALCIRPEGYMLKITSFFVSPEYRGRGAGRFLLEEAKRLFGGDDMEFDIEFLMYGKAEKAFALFLEHYGFSYADPEYEVYLMTVGEMKETSIFGKEGRGVPFAEIPPSVYKQSQNTVLKEGALLPEEGFAAPDIDRDVSVGIIGEDHVIESFVLFENISKDKLLLSSLYSTYGTHALIGMLAESAGRIARKYDDDVKILIQPEVEGGERLMDSIQGQPRMISCRYRYQILGS